jgi:hypothetical protein
MFVLEMQHVCRELGTEFLNITYEKLVLQKFSSLLVQYLTKPYFNIYMILDTFVDLDELHDLKC